MVRSTTVVLYGIRPLLYTSIDSYYEFLVRVLVSYGAIYNYRTLCNFVLVRV